MIPGPRSGIGPGAPFKNHRQNLREGVEEMAQGPPNQAYRGASGVGSVGVQCSCCKSEINSARSPGSRHTKVDHPYH